MRCPVCKTETTRKGNPFRPFCSERCTLIDLDNWLSGRYRIAAVDTEEAPQKGAAAPQATEEDRG